MRITVTQEMQEMINVLNNYNITIFESHKEYFAPEIPDSVIDKILKNIDKNIPINNIVAVYDTTLLNTWKNGLVFTTDGIYIKSMLKKTIYFRYLNTTIFKDKNKFYFKADYPENFEYEYIESGVEYDNLREAFNKIKNIDNRYGQTTEKQSGELQDIKFPYKMQKACHQCIHAASIAAGGVGTGLAQIPTSDNAIIVPIQIAMIIRLGSIFNIDVTESFAKSIIASAGTTYAGRTISQILVGWIPLAGNAINTATAAGVTEAIGWIAVKHFYDRWNDDKAKGRFEGMKVGYMHASEEYEKKLRDQAADFLRQIKNIEKNEKEYKQLIREYEEYIETLERENESDKIRIKELKDILDALMNLKHVKGE